MIATLVEGLVGELLQKKSWSIPPRKTKQEMRKQQQNNNIHSESIAPPTTCSSPPPPLPSDENVISSSPSVKNNEDQDDVVRKGVVSSLENSMQHVLKSTTQQAWKKHKGHDSLASSKEVDDDVFYDSRSSISLHRFLLRSELEDEVSALQRQLEQQQELHTALEKALVHDPGVLPNLIPSHLPAIEQKLLLDIAILEVEVLELEMQMTALRWQLLHESNEHEAVELHSSAHSSQQTIQEMFPVPDVSFSSPNSQSPLQSGDLNLPPLVTLKELLHVPCPESPKSTDDEDLEGLRWIEMPPNANKLSEEMVQCISKIYCQLRDSNNGGILLAGNQSPTSHLGNLVASSLSSVSESSLLSFTRSPLQSLQSQENIMATDATSDPYKSRGKLSWADVGPYNQVIEVRWLSVGKEQLEYAAHALGKFRLLVEQLEKVDPQTMSHEEKLAFWINIYNALMMHAFLAYGIPRSDLKFFNLMQKAAYCVGGHWFTAALIECSLLKGKAMAHRPQFGLMMALQKTRLKEELIKYGIERVEPLVNFALCCGAHSSPMVRVYTAEHVHEELGFAVHGYARAAVGISVKGKLLVPKLLYCHAHETVEDRVLLDWVCNFLPTAQVALIFECIQQRRYHLLQSNNFAVLPFDFSFRYLFPSEICN
ncbi:unnamed protein product [Sphagnum jensenii]|uniref:Uncharacterized protein n=1 Tax=Sphagnum jensenii TaxID=128206 RepID=A0ABP0VSV0_9BRYO